MNRTSVLTAVAVVALLGLSASAPAQVYYTNPYVVTPRAVTYRTASYGVYAQPKMVSYGGYAPVAPFASSVVGVAAYTPVGPAVSSVVGVATYAPVAPVVSSVVAAPYAVAPSYSYASPVYSYPTAYPGYVSTPVYFSTGRGVFIRR